MDLFTEQREAALRGVQPLAVRMRPRSLNDFVGQEHFAGEGKLLRRLLEADRLTSAILYGPPGSGKTTLARLIASYTKAAFNTLHAAEAGVKDVRAVIETAHERLTANGQRTVLFLDEIHRFNRAQQDVLLKDVEEGVLILIGATTENPFFTVNSPLISRSQIFEFHPLTPEQIEQLLRRALADKEQGLGNCNVSCDEEALRFIAERADGDARRALTALEVAVLSQTRSLEPPEGPPEKHGWATQSSDRAPYRPSHRQDAGATQRQDAGATQGQDAGATQECSGRAPYRPSHRQDAGATQGQDAGATQEHDAGATQECSGRAPYRPSHRQDAGATQGQDAGATQRQDAGATQGQDAGTTQEVRVTLEVAAESLQCKAVPYDASGDAHYDVASALIKSMRGSDPDATLYWLARMLEGGEDPRFIARRIAICASEDVGNADPQAAVLAAAAVQITVTVGLPECQFALAQAAVYIACAPKSNAVTKAIIAARRDVREGLTVPVPDHLRDASYRGAARLGRGEGYQYPHNDPTGYVPQDYLGVSKKYYNPTERGEEARLAAVLRDLRQSSAKPPADE